MPPPAKRAKQSIVKNPKNHKIKAESQSPSMRMAQVSVSGTTGIIPIASGMHMSVDIVVALPSANLTIAPVLGWSKYTESDAEEAV
jgi:hypothetical protein